MKRVIYIISILLLGSNVLFAQAKTGSNLKYEGFKFDKRIKGPKHKNSKLIEIMVDDNGYFLAATYKGPKSFLTLVIYELYTWVEVGTYKFKSRAELYNSYFDEDGTYMYLNTDIYKNRYTGIDIKTGELKIMNCDETPQGCNFIETQQYETLGYTAGDNYLLFMDENRKNDLKVYRNKDMMIASSYFDDEIVEESTREKEDVEEVVEKIEEKKVIQKIELSITELEIESIKGGTIIEKNNVKVLLLNDNNKGLKNKVDGEIRYVLLSLVDLSKLSFGNKVVNNDVTVYLKN